MPATPAILQAKAEVALLPARVPRPRPAGASEDPASEAQSSETGAPPGDEPIASPAAADSESAQGDPDPPQQAAVDLPPLPRPRPDLTASEAARFLAVAFHGFTPDLRLKAALDALAAGRYAEARAIADDHRDPFVSTLLDWSIARQPGSGLSAAEIVKVLRTHRDWPEPEKMVLRAEQAFHALGPDADQVLAFYSLAEPRTVAGRLALASALREKGRKAEAIDIVRDLWRNWTLGSNQAAAIVSRFGTGLTREDHIYRFRRLVLRRDARDAITQAQLLGADYESLARAVIAALDRKPEARRLLRQASAHFFSDPLYVFAQVHLARRSGYPIEAARLLLRANPNDERGGDGDIWWDERRDLSRMLLDRGVPDLAYRIVADAHPQREGNQVEAEFHAGWYALRFLHDPALAEPHFRQLHVLATIPRSQSRASYWLGRTNEALGRIEAARLDYRDAAQYGGTFYGQLAREKLGIVTTGLERTPRPSALDRVRFAQRPNVRAVRLLAAAGYADAAAPFLRALGETIDTPGEGALLMSLARRLERPDAGTAAAAIAEQRGLKVASLPAPFLGVPAPLPLPDPVDRALVYAVVRQESAFNHGAVSHAGARGLMQLMPATARATARNAQLPFSVQRLTTDPLYNATLGAHHIGELLGGLKRSYVLTFVGYNAGPGRALDWVQAYGDPRGGAVDPVDWIERIPFDETRDYVQKVMENLQVYRSRNGHPLSLSKDLVRGGPQG